MEYFNILYTRLNLKMLVYIGLFGNFQVKTTIENHTSTNFAKRILKLKQT